MQLITQELVDEIAAATHRVWVEKVGNKNSGWTAARGQGENPEGGLSPMAEVGIEKATRLATLETQKKFVKLAREIFSEEVTLLGQKLIQEEISLSSWQTQMKGLIKGLHSTVSIAAKGGEAGLMTASDWGKVGAKVKVQYGYLKGFADDIYDKVSEGWAPNGAIPARARLYSSAAQKTYYDGMAVNGNMEALWVMTAGKDHCATCVEQEGLGWRKLKNFPFIPGESATICDGGCWCTLEFREPEAVEADLKEVMDVFVPNEQMDIFVAKGLVKDSVKSIE